MQTEPGDFDGRFYSHLFDTHLALVDIDKREMAVLNPTAAALWLLLDGKEATEEDLARDLAEVFSVCSDEVRDDVSCCLVDWTTNGWIEGPNDLGQYGRSPSLPHTALRKGLAVAQEGERPPPIPTETIHCRLHDRSFSIAVGQSEEPLDSELAPRLFAMLSGLPSRESDDQTDAPVFLRVLVDQERIWVDTSTDLLWSTDPLDALNHLLLLLMDLGYPQAHLIAAVHAAALRPPAAQGSTGDGVILFPGLSGRGKSTLSAYLAARGWSYGGDDFTGLGEEGDTDHVMTAVLPCPTSISVKPGSWPLLAPLYHGLMDRPITSYIGKTARFMPVAKEQHVGKDGTERRLRAFVFPHYDPQSPAGLVPLSLQDTLLSLVDAGFSTGERCEPDRLARLFGVLEETPAYRLSYASLEEAEQCLLNV
ncbi:PqqD family peptide modification chaperone [Rhodospirillum sp. A1_3_36]|uniref:PqqD family peptide modification chaperone n=1 Tax=Rhodospirillum sp. A1_3_36 TaxID=3391666 RepID=UPI0039A4942E